MVGTWTYDAPSNTVTVTGGTSGSPASIAIDGYAADVAGGWGVITRLNNYQYQLACKFNIGDGSTETHVKDSEKQFVLADGVVGSWAYYFEVKANAYLTFGNMENQSQKATNQGVSFICLDVDIAVGLINNLVGGYKQGTIYLYSCQFTTLTYTSHITAHSGRIWNCILTKHVMLRWCYNADIYNVTIQKEDTYHAIATSSGTMDRILVQNVGNVFYSLGYETFSASNVVARGCVNFMQVYGAGSANFNFTNVDSDVMAFTFDASWTGKVYWKYLFDLQVLDKDGVAISEASVILKQADNTTVINATTDAIGKISQTTVTRGYYNRANDNTLQDYGPFKLTVTKTGYMPYVLNDIILNKNLDWRIYMRAQLSGDAGTGDVLKNKTFYTTDADSKLTGTLEYTGGGLICEMPEDKKELLDASLLVTTTLIMKEIKRRKPQSQLPR